MNRTAPPKPGARIADVGSMRADAAWFLDQVTLPRHGLVALFARDFTRNLHDLMPCIEQLATLRGVDDVPTQAALAGVAETHRRLAEPEAAGLAGEVARVRRLARSVRCLCDHYEALSEVRMCVACDRPVEGADDTVPYDRIVPSAHGGRSALIHARCTPAMWPCG
ncbi:DUF6415 family natural product biosynthesis protein [Streptomyces sp. NPDC012461]|uniref:Uncharacterized protein n=2 Tax=unclassified Streptomyces TaxID=2593676 RepID=A0A6G3QPX8_9ACTN|nr:MULTISPECIES: DUF6415 family natural product biosynthesis protein [unclassified Streptomyces]MBM7092475.1 hypothetical protein [Streptomyces sp. S12]NEA85543.1 hypothetical protein [Streptomyces sp. SID14436]NEC27963.1 hypothetical protein [Streptomyces sp. SID8111]NEC80563.1 hypothetical protein [Streptomyces sp. SID7958]NED19525.1 hypothetical protein [Streptomyces sp. SID9913]